MATLTAATRAHIPTSQFALPGRRYPIHDEAHARDALSRVSANGTGAEQAAVRAAVKRRYPGIGQQHLAKGGFVKPETPQRAKVHKTMSEFEDRQLHSGSKTGPLVHSRDQAVAIALSQAGLSRGEKKKRNPLLGIR